MVVHRVDKDGGDIILGYFSNRINNLRGNGWAVNIHGLVGDKKVIEVGDVVLAAPSGDTLPQTIITFTSHVHNDASFSFMAMPGFA